MPAGDLSSYYAGSIGAVTSLGLAQMGSGIYDRVPGHVTSS